MYSAILLVASALMGNVLAAPLLTRGMGANIEVTDLKVHYVPDDQSSLTFKLRDQSTTANDTAVCSTTFTGTSGRGAIIQCRDSKTSYTGSVDGWDNFDQFLLHFKHSYHEPLVGIPDYVSVFANTNVNSSSIVCIPCEESDTPTTNCAQPSGTVILAPITSSIAKR